MQTFTNSAKPDYYVDDALSGDNSPRYVIQLKTSNEISSILEILNYNLFDLTQPVVLTVMALSGGCAYTWYDLFVGTFDDFKQYLQTAEKFTGKAKNGENGSLLLKFYKKNYKPVLSELTYNNFDVWFKEMQRVDKSGIPKFQVNVLDQVIRDLKVDPIEVLHDTINYCFVKIDTREILRINIIKRHLQKNPQDISEVFTNAWNKIS